MKKTVEIPCQIGDVVYGVKNTRGAYIAERGIVSEMYFVPCGDGMKLQILLKYICRGSFGESIFLTREECEAECKRRNER